MVGLAGIFVDSRASSSLTERGELTPTIRQCLQWFHSRFRSLCELWILPHYSTGGKLYSRLETTFGQLRRGAALDVFELDQLYGNWYTTLSLPLVTAVLRMVNLESAPLLVWEL
jgi:hypothetical protein